MSLVIKDVRVVYVIHNPATGLNKVGVTKNIKNRHLSLQCSCGVKLYVMYTTTPIENHFEVEKAIHNRFAGQRKIGEWFDVNYKQIISFINTLDMKGSLFIEECLRVGLTDTANKYGITKQNASNRLTGLGIKNGKKMEIPMSVSSFLVTHKDKRVEKNIYQCGDRYSVIVRVNGTFERTDNLTLIDAREKRDSYISLKMN